MPAFNEAATIGDVLDRLVGHVDHLIVVDDGSVDGTGALADAWASRHGFCRVIHFPENRGLSAALRAGWDEVAAMEARGEVTGTDIAFSIDADGQHEPEAIDGMIAYLVEHDLACVIGRRDLAYHSPYKRFGNRVMTWIGRLSGGVPFEDIECGYRVFRIGPLLHAQEYYTGFRYSETVEVAVILARLGYRVDNSFPVRIPVARTRTRLSDAVVDAVCMPLAWYRLACWRGLSRSQRSGFLAGYAAFIALLAAGAVAIMLTHSFYLGDDSAHSYAHVWYLSNAIFSEHRLPLYMPPLENGNAVMFPYAFVPWVPSALLYPLLGDWVVTLSMAIACVLVVVGAVRMRPALRNPPLLGVFLLNPLLWNGITQFQLATMWSFAFFFFGAAAFEAGHRRRSVILLALAVVAHPLMGLLAVATWAVADAIAHRAIPRAIIAHGAVAAALASPAVYFFLKAPLLTDANYAMLAASAADNCRRLTVVALPLALAAVPGWFFRHLRAVFATGSLGTAAILLAVAPSGLWERSHERFTDYRAAVGLNGDAAYRVLVANNHEDGMVEFLRWGAVLSHEFYSESVRRQSFSLEAYRCFLATTGARHVVVSREYLHRYARLNEPRLLDELVALGLATREYDGPDGVAFTIHLPETDARGSVRGCGI